MSMVFPQKEKIFLTILPGFFIIIGRGGKIESLTGIDSRDHES